MSEEKTDTSDNIEESNANSETENSKEGSSELVQATQAQAKQFSESVKNSLESLVSVVLDSAEVANKSAEVSSNSTRSLLRGVDRLNNAHSKGSKQSLFVLFICGFSSYASFVFLYGHGNQTPRENLTSRCNVTCYWKKSFRYGFWR